MTEQEWMSLKPKLTPKKGHKIVYKMSGKDEATLETVKDDGVLLTVPIKHYIFISDAWAILGYRSYFVTYDELKLKDEHGQSRFITKKINDD